MYDYSHKEILTDKKIRIYCKIPINNAYEETEHTKGFFRYRLNTNLEKKKTVTDIITCTSKKSSFKENPYTCIH